MNSLVCLLEEPSAKEMLKAVMSKLAPDASVDYIVFQGKSDLDKNIERKINGFRRPDAKFLILRDQDSSDCRQLKSELINSIPERKRAVCLVRIACRELESFYLGDLAAVERGLKLNNLSKRQNQKKYKNPDCLANAKEVLRGLTARQYQPVDGSRRIAPELDLTDNNCSKSFNQLISGIRRLLQQ